MVNGTKYAKTNTSGASTFSIPVDLNSEFHFTGPSSAMGPEIASGMTAVIDEPAAPTPITDITNKTGMFKVSAAQLETADGQTYLRFTLGGKGYHELFQGTYEEAVANGDGTADKGNDTWIHGATPVTLSAGAYEFVMPVQSGRHTYAITAVSNSYYGKYLSGANPLARAFYPRYLTLDTDAPAIESGDYNATDALDATVTGKAPAVTAAALNTVGGPNSNGYQENLALTTDAQAAYVGTASAASAATEGVVAASDGVITFDLIRGDTFGTGGAIPDSLAVAFKLADGTWVDTTGAVSKSAKTVAIAGEEAPLPDAPAFANGASFNLRVKEGQEVKGRSLSLKGGAATDLSYDEGLLEGSGVALALNGDGTKVTMTGTAGAAGTYTVPATVSNAGGSATLALTVTVGTAQATVATESLPDGTVGQPYSATIETSGSPVARAILVTGSVLPGGLTYTENGDGTATISGTPTEAGDFQLTIHPTNNVSSTVNKTLTLTVNEPAAPRVERLSGALSDDTAAAIAARAYEGETSEYVVVSRDDTYYDALSGAGLAGALGAPILLTGTSGLSGACRDAIASLGATRAVVLGGENAVSGQVVSELEAMGLSVERVAGDDVYGTSMACTRYLLAHGGSQRYAIACNPTSFVDAVSISGWAYANRVPVMLQTWGATAAERGFDAEAASVIAGRDLIVCGGEMAVSDGSVNSLGAASVTRLGGDTLYDTNLEIVGFALENGMSASDVAVASDIYSFSGVDALAASALAGRRGGVVLLAQSNPAYEPAVEIGSALGFISAHASEVSRVHVLGGEVAQTPEFYRQIEDALS